VLVPNIRTNPHVRGVWDKKNSDPAGGLFKQPEEFLEKEAEKNLAKNDF
jgi:hypothetical protein